MSEDEIRGKILSAAEDWMRHQAGQPGHLRLAAAEQFLKALADAVVELIDTVQMDKNNNDW